MPRQPMNSSDELIYDTMTRALDQHIVSSQGYSREIDIEVKPESILIVCRYLRDNQKLRFSFPADMTAFDTGEDLYVWYRIWSHIWDKTALVSAKLDRENPALPSVTSL